MTDLEAVQRHRGAVYGYLRARLPQPDLAERLAAKVFAERPREPVVESELLEHLLQAAGRILRDHAGNAPAWTALCLELDSIEPSVELDAAAGSGCCAALGPSARDALDLRYRAGWDPEQIGERLRRSAGAVRTLLARARRAVRVCLETGALPEEGG